MDSLMDYAPLVRAMARRYQGPGLEEEDLEQEAWLALATARVSYRPEFGVPRPAYYKSRVRAALAEVLRRWRRDALFWRAAQEADDLQARYEETGDGLFGLTAGLPLRQRQVLEMYFGQDLPLKEIGCRLGISTSAVHTHKQRGLAALAGLYPVAKRATEMHLT